jgi:Fic family protein
MDRNALSHRIRERLRRYTGEYANHYGVVPYPPPETGVSTVPVQDRLARANQALGEIDALAANMPDTFFVSRILSRQEAVSSSSIEGTHSTLDEALSVEESDADEGQATKEAKQVRDYALALERFLPLARDRGQAVFTLDLVQDLHRAAMKNDPAYENVPGELRTRVVWIGGTGNIAYSIYNPAPPEDVQVCLEQTLDYMRGDGMQMMQQDLLTRMAIAHAHFEAVHPFRDGNGRVGRLLLPLMMAAEGKTPLYLSPYIAAHKDPYVAALAAAQQREQWHEIVGFLADAVVGSVEELKITRAALEGLRAHWTERRRFRANSAATRALGLLVDYPVVTVGRLSKLLGVTFAAAGNAVEQLVEAGILRERTGYSRNRIFSAHEALQILNRPFGTDPALAFDDGDATVQA